MKRIKSKQIKGKSKQWMGKLNYYFNQNKIKSIIHIRNEFHEQKAN